MSKCNCLYTLTPNAVILFFFHRTLWLLMMYQTKFGCQGIHSLENIVERIIFWSYDTLLTLTLKIAATTKILHASGSWCCITIPNLVTKCSVSQKISSRQTFKHFEHLLWPWPRTLIPFSHKMLWLMMLYYQTKFSCKPTSSLEDTTEIVIFWLYKPLLWPWHWTQWTTFSAWHWFMMLHNIIRFGNKMCGSEDIWTNIH